MNTPRHFQTVLTALGLFTLSSLGRAEEGVPNMDWVPPQAMGEGLRVEDNEQIIPEVTITQLPKKTADVSKFTRKQEIDLAKFGILNDGTHASETSKGINAALQQAKADGANYIIFPKGTYLIDENDPVLLNFKDAIIDLNGATLQIQTNGLPNYTTVLFADGAENLRLTNGTIRGDKDTHDYKTKPGTHEWGACIRFIGGKELEVDHLSLINACGDGMSSSVNASRSRPELLSLILYTMEQNSVEQGAFSDKGEKIASTEKMRTIKPVDISKHDGGFELGYMAGYCGFPFVKGRVYQVYFYDKDQKFLSMQKWLQYRRITVPEGAKYANFELNQPEVSEEPAHAGAAKGSWILRVTKFNPSRDVHFHHNIVEGNRRLGMALCGGQRWVIEENQFNKNGGTNPAYGVDLEDGAELVYDIVFRKNTFKDNINGDLVICAGTELLIEDNVFQKSVVLWGRPHNYIFTRNRFNGGSVVYKTRTGVASIHNNFYANCKLSMTFDTKAAADGIARTAGEKVTTKPLELVNESLDNVTKIGGTYVNFKNSALKNSQIIAGENTRMISLDGCTLENTTLEFEEKGPQVSFSFVNNKGDLPITGEGQSRKMGSPAE